MNPITDTPTIVLIHGAFADSSSWAGVITEIQNAGLIVIAPPNPLRGIAADSAYLTSVIEQIAGPVLLVGHSYGGALITQIGANLPNVVGLVYVAAFAPSDGETMLAIIGRFPDVAMGASLRPRRFAPAATGEPGTEFLIDTAGFHAAFCADLPDAQAKAMAVSQRPAAVEAFATPMTGVPAWTSLPCWTVISTADNAIHPEAQRFMARRAAATVTEIAASHCVALSHAAETARVICDAAFSVRPATKVVSA